MGHASTFKLFLRSDYSALIDLQPSAQCVTTRENERSPPSDGSHRVVRPSQVAWPILAWYRMGAGARGFFDGLRAVWADESTSLHTLTSPPTPAGPAPICEAGKYLQLLSSTCKDCPVGKYKSNTGAGSCRACKEGSVAPNKGTAECDECQPGYFYINATSPCEPCSKGYYSVEAGVKECFPCFPNSFTDEVGMDECIPCPAGTSTKGESGAEKCTPK
eukprot:gene15255-21338_t